MSEMYQWKDKWKEALFGLSWGTGKISLFIRVLQTFRGEMDTWTNHSFNVLMDGISIIESTFKGTKKSEWKKYGEKGQWGVLIGIKNLSNSQRNAFDRWSWSMMNEEYAFVSIVKQGVDGLLSKIAGRDIRFARKFHLFKNKMTYNICAWLTSNGLKKIGIDLYGWVNHIHREQKGVRIRVYRMWTWEKLNPNSVNPDDIWDNVFETWDPPPPSHWKNPNEFYVVEEIGDNRPEGLPQAIIDKLPPK